MKSSWKLAFAKTTLWLAVEIILTIVGLDNLADYSEFVFEREFTGGAAIVAVQTPNL